MVDWTQSMQQTFEYYVVDPGTWKDVRPLNTVRSSSITREAGSETLGSASFSVDELVGECYVRVYLITIQNGIREKHALGTYLVQTPSTSFNGKVHTIELDAYTPLIELKEKQPSIGYSMLEGDNIMENAYIITRNNVRAPVVKPDCNEKLLADFVANLDDTWASFIYDLVDQAKYQIELDELGRILFSPKQDAASLQPVWTFDDDNSSILLPEISMDHDLYGIPNVVEVTFSSGRHQFFSRVENKDENSPTSIQSRGREIVHRIYNPNLGGMPSQLQVDLYAEKTLRDLSTLEYTVSYTHGYCPVRVNDCVRLNYKRAGITNVKAKVISQNIDCKPGCTVTETAIFTNKLWR